MLTIWTPVAGGIGGPGGEQLASHSYGGANAAAPRGDLGKRGFDSPAHWMTAGSLAVRDRIQTVVIAGGPT